MITAQKCNKKMKKCKILPFQNHQFDKNSVFGPFFVDYPLLPADMINFLINTVSTFSFAPEKVVRTWGEPQKKLFFTNIWSLSQICQKQGWALKNDPLLGNKNVFNMKKVFNWTPDIRVPKVLLHPPKKWIFWPKYGQIWPKTGIFGQISAFLANLI